MKNNLLPIDVKQLKSWRHHLHTHPELSWEEFATTDYIEEALRKMGIKDIEKPLETGLIATITHGEGKTIALRADIDALPIQELNSCEYKSQNSGVMHACGHDVHTTCLLGAAKYLVENTNSWSGTIKFLFQPSEEKQPSGAEALIKKGALNNVESIIGLHVTPELEVGKLGFRSGQFMASADELYIDIIGKGGHGAAPEYCIDPIIIASNIILALQTMVSRAADPKTPTVVNIGDIQGHGATNIIPDRVHLKGTIRTFDETWRIELHKKIKTLCEHIAESYGGSCQVEIPRGLPYVFNDLELTEKLKSWTTSILGPNHVVDMPMRMGAEDFAFYGHSCPASFFRLGTGGKTQDTQHSVHNAHFDIDESALLIGASAMAYFAINMLGE